VVDDLIKKYEGEISTLEFFSKVSCGCKKNCMWYKCENIVTKRMLKRLIDIIIFNLRISLNAG
jgi:hypothetical protein